MTVPALALLLSLHGCSPACAAGIAGNLWIESRLQPCIANGRYVGMAQLAGPRKQRFLAWAGRRWCDAGMQVQFIVQELGEIGLKDRLFRTRDPGEAARLFAVEYERGRGTGLRMAAARRLYGQIKGGSE